MCASINLKSRNDTCVTRKENNQFANALKTISCFTLNDNIIKIKRNLIRTISETDEPTVLVIGHLNVVKRRYYRLLKFLRLPLNRTFVGKDSNDCRTRWNFSTLFLIPHATNASFVCISEFKRTNARRKRFTCTIETRVFGHPAVVLMSKCMSIF